MTDELVTPGNLAPGKSSVEGELITQRRYRLVEEIAPPFHGVALDFGCGNGAQTMMFAPHFDLTIGADISDAYVDEFNADAARRGLAETTIGIRYDGNTLPVADRSVDYVLSFEVIEHVEDEKRALDEIARVLKPGGVFAMSVPNRWWVFETHGAELPLLKWNRVPFFSWLPKRIHDRYARARIYRRREIEKMVRQAGFSITRSTYVTAPMDRVGSPAVQKLLRKTLFGADETGVPFLSTAVLLVATRAES